MSTNLWPDFDDTKLPRSPKAVVEQAGEGLREKTKGRVLFMLLGNTSITKNRVEAAFSLYAPALSYHFPFLRITFGIESMYPVEVVADKMEGVANDESELITLLGKIFSAPSTVATVERLMALANE